MNYFGNLYTLIEIAINNNIQSNRLKSLSHYMKNKNVEGIKENFQELVKFIPYCNWYVIQGQNMLAMSAYLYDLYKDTGLLPELSDIDINPDTEKLEHWQYINPLIFEINPESGFEFAKKIYNDCDIWSLFLSGSARIDFYERNKYFIGTENKIRYC